MSYHVFSVIWESIHTYLISIDTLNSYNGLLSVVIVIPSLSTVKLERFYYLRHRASKWSCWNLIPAGLPPEALLLTTILHCLSLSLYMYRNHFFHHRNYLLNETQQQRTLLLMPLKQRWILGREMDWRWAQLQASSGIARWCLQTPEQIHGN